MTLSDRIQEALEQDVHSDDGWLSDAQNANLRVQYDGTVEFCGEGSIDLKHLIAIVLEEVENDERN